MRTMIAVLAAALFAVPMASQAQSLSQHRIVMPGEVAWGPAPPSLPPGAQAATLYGDPTKPGVFALRLKLPKGYHIPPHTHPMPEIVTVISGTFRIGMGPNPDHDKARALPSGGFFGFDPGMTHYAYTDEATVVQLNSIGPWVVNYVNPQDDPRRKGK